MHYVIVIAMSAKPRAASRFQDKLDDLVMDTTMEGGIDSLSTDVYEGKEALRLLEAGQPQPKQRLIEAVIRETGQVVLVPEPEPEVVPPTDQARRLARLNRLGAPEPRPDDGLDRHAEHKRLREQQEKQNNE